MDEDLKEMLPTMALYAVVIFGSLAIGLTILNEHYRQKRIEEAKLINAYITTNNCKLTGIEIDRRVMTGHKRNSVIIPSIKTYACNNGITFVHNEY